jgi:hypothetical protein
VGKAIGYFCRDKNTKVYIGE